MWPLSTTVELCYKEIRNQIGNRPYCKLQIGWHRKLNIINQPVTRIESYHAYISDGRYKNKPYIGLQEPDISVCNTFPRMRCAACSHCWITLLYCTSGYTNATTCLKTASPITARAAILNLGRFLSGPKCASHYMYYRHNAIGMIWSPCNTFIHFVVLSN